MSPIYTGDKEFGSRILPVDATAGFLRVPRIADVPENGKPTGEPRPSFVGAPVCVGTDGRLWIWVHPQGDNAGEWRTVMGADGDDGDDGNDGSSLTPKGSWQINTAYEVGDVVTINDISSTAYGSAYGCSAAHTSAVGQQPTGTSDARWKLLVRRGLDGPFRYRGVWTANRAYVYGDLVRVYANRRMYFCRVPAITANFQTSIHPSGDSNWSVFLQDGNDGASGRNTNLVRKADVRATTACIGSTAFPSPNTYNATARTITASADGNINSYARIARDGLTFAVGDRLLLQEEHNEGLSVEREGTSNERNGIWQISELGGDDSRWVLRRATDFNSTADVENGAEVYVKEGRDANTKWVLITLGTITVGTTPVRFRKQVGGSGIESVSTDGTTIAGDGVNTDLSVVTPFTLTERSKLAGIEAQATKDQSATEIRDSLQTLTGDTRLDATAIKNLPEQGDEGLTSVSSDATLNGDGTSGTPLKVANPFTDGDETKLDGIEDGATQDQTATEIRDSLQTLTGDNRLDASAVKNLPEPGDGGLTSVASDSTLDGNGTTGTPLRVANPFTDADETKLDGIEDGATQDQSATEIRDSLQTLTEEARLDASAVKNLPQPGDGGLTSVASDNTLSGDGTSGMPLKVANEFTDADETKLDGIEEGATQDQSATEIRDSLQTLTTDNRLDASAIKNLPEVPNAFAPVNAEENVQSDWNVIDDQLDSFIKNKPSISSEEIANFVVGETSEGEFQIDGRGRVRELSSHYYFTREIVAADNDKMLVINLMWCLGTSTFGAWGTPVMIPAFQFTDGLVVGNGSATSSLSINNFVATTWALASASAYRRAFIVKTANDRIGVAVINGPDQDDNCRIVGIRVNLK